MQKRFCNVVRVAIALTIFLTILIGTRAASQGQQTVVIVNPEANGQPQSLSPENIRNATPVPFPTLQPSETGLQQVLPVPESTSDNQSPVVISESGLPDPDANRAAATAFPHQWTNQGQANAEQVSEADGIFANAAVQAEECAPSWGPLDWCQHPRTSYWGNYWKSLQTQYPWKAVGKLMFRDDEDDWHFCTAQVITGPPKNLIATAGHCVYYFDKKVYYKDWTFIPAAMNGNEPYGEFKFKTVRVLTRWIDGGNSRDDVALISLQNNSKGEPVGFYTGWLGVQLNLPYTQNLTLMGYSTNNSTNDDLKGKWTTVNHGQSFFFEDDTICPGFSGEDAVFIGSDFAPGSSGGAWISQLQPFQPSAAGNYVVSVVSGPLQCSQGGVVTSPSGIIEGARFSDANIGILCKAEGGCVTPLPGGQN